MWMEPMDFTLTAEKCDLELGSWGFFQPESETLQGLRFSACLGEHPVCLEHLHIQRYPLDISFLSCFHLTLGATRPVGALLHPPL